jgi:hypothetical protein
MYAMRQGAVVELAKEDLLIFGANGHMNPADRDRR